MKSTTKKKKVWLNFTFDGKTYKIEQPDKKIFPTSRFRLKQKPQKGSNKKPNLFVEIIWHKASDGPWKIRSVSKITIGVAVEV